MKHLTEAMTEEEKAAWDTANSSGTHLAMVLGRLGALTQVVRRQYGELTRLHRDYELFEEMSPPDIPHQEFVKWCLYAWEQQCQVKEALAYLFDNDWTIRIFCDVDGRVRVIGHHAGLVDHDTDGITFAKAIQRLAASVKGGT